MIPTKVLWQGTCVCFVKMGSRTFVDVSISKSCIREISIKNAKETMFFLDGCAAKSSYIVICMFGSGRILPRSHFREKDSLAAKRSMVENGRQPPP